MRKILAAALAVMCVAGPLQAGTERAERSTTAVEVRTPAETQSDLARVWRQRFIRPLVGSGRMGEFGHYVASTQ